MELIANLEPVTARPSFTNIWLGKLVSYDRVPPLLPTRCGGGGGVGSWVGEEEENWLTVQVEG